MRYTININQYASVRMGLGLDIIDLAILDCVSTMMLSGRLAKMNVDGVTYYWVKASVIREDIPILGISSDRGINNRIDNLIMAGLLVRCSENEKLNRCYLAIGPRFEEYMDANKTQDPRTDFQGTLEQPFHGPLNEISRDYSTKDYNTSDYIPPISPRAKKPGKIAYAEGVELTEKEYSNLCKDYGKEDADGMIQYLSSYKKERGYKTKDCNLTIRRWVADAYYKKRPRSGGFPDNGWVKILNGIHDGERTDYVDEQ